MVGRKHSFAGALLEGSVLRWSQSGLDSVLGNTLSKTEGSASL